MTRCKNSEGRLRPPRHSGRLCQTAQHYLGANPTSSLYLLLGSFPPPSPCARSVLTALLLSICSSLRSCFSIPSYPKQEHACSPLRHAHMENTCEYPPTMSPSSLNTAQTRTGMNKNTFMPLFVMEGPSQPHAAVLFPLYLEEFNPRATRSLGEGMTALNVSCREQSNLSPPGWFGVGC